MQGPDDKAASLYGRLLQRRAEVLVDNCWKDILAVADLLIEHKTLDADAVYAATHRAHGLRPFVLEATACRRLSMNALSKAFWRSRQTAIKSIRMHSVALC
jgi:hypothetical protein